MEKLGSLQKPSSTVISVSQKKEQTSKIPIIEPPKPSSNIPVPQKQQPTFPSKDASPKIPQPPLQPPKSAPKLDPPSKPPRSPSPHPIRTDAFDDDIDYEEEDSDVDDEDDEDSVVREPWVVNSRNKENPSKNTYDFINQEKKFDTRTR